MKMIEQNGHKTLITEPGKTIVHKNDPFTYSSDGGEIGLNEFDFPGNYIERDTPAFVCLICGKWVYEGTYYEINQTPLCSTKCLVERLDAERFI